MLKKRILIKLFFLFFSINTFGQTNCDPLDDPNCQSNPDESVPLDDGIIYLLGAAITIALFKLRSMDTVNALRERL